MTEDVLVSVKGLHALDTADEEEVEVFSAGKYYFKNGKHYVLYDEMVEDTTTVVKNRITLKNGRMEVKKTGPFHSQLVFEEEKKTNSWYSTPFGQLMAGIEVHSMRVKEEENLIEIRVEYALEINYEKVSDCQIQIKIMAKDSGLFKLR